MKQKLIEWVYVKWLRFEYRFAMVSAYLSDCRGDNVSRVNHQQRAWNAERELQRVRLNKIYGGLYGQVARTR